MFVRSPVSVLICLYEIIVNGIEQEFTGNSSKMAGMSLLFFVFSFIPSGILLFYNIYFNFIYIDVLR